MEAVGRLAGGIAHDFNNLLMGILSYTRIALDDLEPASPAAPLLREVLQAVETGGRLTRHLLDFSRKRPTCVQPLALDALLTGAQDMLRKLAGDDVVLRVVTQACAGAIVLADAVQIEQVLMNLVVNARDAMPRGGRIVIECKAVEMTVATVDRRPGLQPGPHVVLSVADTGSGMSPDVKARALEPFFTTKPPGKGTGLGLSTVYGITIRLGGHLEIDSELGRGTTVRLTLPRTTQAAAPGPDGSADGVPVARGETVLVVDDSRLVRSSVRHFLRGSGYTVLEASDGEEALQVARQHDGTIHLLLTDVLMPNVDGLELATRLRQERPQIQVVFMSARIDDVLERPDMQAWPVMEKPFSREAVARRVRASLDEPVTPDEPVIPEEPLTPDERVTPPPLDADGRCEA